jgi:hypothetical protein
MMPYLTLPVDVSVSGIELHSLKLDYAGTSLTGSSAREGMEDPNVGS